MWSVKCLLCSIHVRCEHRHLQSSVGEVETRQSLALIGRCTEIAPGLVGDPRSENKVGFDWEGCCFLHEHTCMCTHEHIHVYMWTHMHTYFLLPFRLLVYFIFSNYWLLGPWASKPLVTFLSAYTDSLGSLCSGWNQGFQFPWKSRGLRHFDSPGIVSVFSVVWRSCWVKLCRSVEHFYAHSGW